MSQPKMRRISWVERRTIVASGALFMRVWSRFGRLIFWGRAYKVLGRYDAQAAELIWGHELLFERGAACSSMSALRHESFKAPYV